ncbi:hypothetical protein EC988_004529 [Linderina pennispora]|nr:hypothetical protein EC988_004529 [Linderina pennispora]
MKITTAFVAVAALVGLSVDGQSVRCSSQWVRKEVRNLSPSELNTVKSTITAMQNAGWMGWFAYLHSNNFGTIHNCEHFLPFHRRFVHDFESVGRRINPAFVLPYWDELRDYANPAASAIFTSNYFGGNGQGANHCVTNGLQANWQMSYPSNHCFARQFNNGNRINAWYSPEYIQSVLSRSSTMAQIRAGIEYSLHGAIHLAVGGDMVQMHSPNDFIFWLHHANIDRLWSVWQGSNRIWTMDGVDTANRPLSLSSNVIAYNEPIWTVMQLGYNKMCFSYDNVGSVSNRRRSLDKRNAVYSATAPKKCIPRPVTTPVKAYVPPLVNGVFENFQNMTVNADKFVETYVAQKLPAPVLNKWFPTYTANPSNNGTTTGPEYSAVPLPSAEASGSESAEASESGSYVALPSAEASDVYNSAEESALYSEDYVAYEDTEGNALYGLDNGKGPAYPMPNPYPLTPAWCAMHKFPAEEVHKFYADAKEFVRDMNNVGYQSPFAKV